MLSNKKTPTGLYFISASYLLSSFTCLLIIILASLFNLWKELYMIAILIPILIYAGVGIIKRWSGARYMAIAITVLSFPVGVYILGNDLMGSQEVSSTKDIISGIVQLAISIIIFFYLISDKVKSYYS